MIHNLSITFMGLSIALSIGLPIGLIVYFLVKKKFSLQPVLGGAIVFFVAQIMLRIPLQMRLAETATYQSLMSNIIIYGLFSGLMAGVFEEVGRYVGFGRMRKRRNFWDAVGFGLGHGGFEAIIIGVQILNNLTVALAINDGSIHTAYAGLDPSVITQMIDVLTSTNSFVFLLSGFERVFAIVIQVAFSIIVMKAIRERKIKYLFIAIGLHMLVDAPLAILTSVGLWITEGYIMICAIVAGWYVRKTAKENWPIFVIEDLPSKKTINKVDKVDKVD